MTDAQTEAREIARYTFTLGHDPIYDAPCVNKVPTDSMGSRAFVPYPIHATALAAKDAELADLREKNDRMDASIVRLTSRADRIEALERQLAEARAEYLSASKDAMELAGKLNAAEAECDQLAAHLSENNRWPDPLKSPQAEAIRNGKIDMTEIVSLFDKMEREIEQLRLVAADNAQLREALEPFGKRCDEAVRPDDSDNDGVTIKTRYLRAARTALQEGGGE